MQPLDLGEPVQQPVPDASSVLIFFNFNRYSKKLQEDVAYVCTQPPYTRIGNIWT